MPVVVLVSVSDTILDMENSPRFLVYLFLSFRLFSLYIIIMFIMKMAVSGPILMMTTQINP